MSVVWVTGARGFIGRHLASRVAAQGDAVLGVGHGAWPADAAAHWGLRHWLNGDVVGHNLDVLCNAGGPPEVVYHLAGGSSVGLSFHLPAEDFTRSVLSCSALLEWLRVRAPAARLVFASSAAVYGAGYQRPIAENDATQPYSPYGYHKRICELELKAYAQSFGLRIAVVRLFSVFGAGLRKQLLWDLCSRLEGRPETVELGGSGEELRDWLHVSDAVAHFTRAADYASTDGYILNAGTGQGVCVGDIAALVRDSWDPGIGLRFSGTSRPGDPFSLVADVSLAASLNIRPGADLRQSIVEYVAWFKTRGET